MDGLWDGYIMYIGPFCAVYNSIALDQPGENASKAFPCKKMYVENLRNGAELRSITPVARPH